MRRESASALIIVGVLLLLAGVAVAYFGVQHEISQIPAVDRSAMTDFDWIGTEWVERGGVVLLGGVGLVIAGFVLRSRGQAPNRHVA